METTVGKQPKQPSWVPAGAGNTQSSQEVDICPPDLEDFGMADLIALHGYWESYQRMGGYNLQTDFDKAVDLLISDVRAEVDYRCCDKWPAFKEAWLNQDDD